MTINDLAMRYLAADIGERVLKMGDGLLARVEEIRIRLGRPLILRAGGADFFMGEDGTSCGDPPARPFLPNEAHLRGTLERLCRQSVYAFADDIRAGFLTLPGGHRVGISGGAAAADGRVSAISHITGLNIRIAREIIGCADGVIPLIYGSGGLAPTLIISPPGCGKTTLLRDIIRRISNDGESVALVDERGEVGGAYLGVAQKDLGMRTDILDGAPKAEGMMMMLRSMGPDVVAADEIGSAADAAAIAEISTAGVSVLCTIHGKDLTDLKQKSHLANLLTNNTFRRYIFLSRNPKPGSITQILDENFQRV